MTSFRRAAMLLVAVVFLLLSPQAALAHVTVSPNVIGPNEFGTFTFTVPNESEKEDTVGVDVRLPKGFILEDAQQLAG